ncbi:hypothetical protein DIURU_003401 [Diutina rugosa]|uniref:Uncharacterized protein n=1 Tax=Diutina rugosa TaxID=5481 RepID=A0A642UKZ3_DIURU|nr:uncharacterized protein DIURU_003401 [Diutina rugosa]KAA8901031.1 hypothetical protein DIURU_003401 [Diutina rugosa]
MKISSTLGFALIGVCVAVEPWFNTIEPSGDGFVKTEIAGQPYWYKTQLLPELDPGQIVYTTQGDVFDNIFSNFGQFSLLSDYVDNYSKYLSKFTDVIASLPTVVVGDPGVETANTDAGQAPSTSTQTQSLGDGVNVDSAGGGEADATSLTTAESSVPVESASVDSNERSLRGVTLTSSSAEESVTTAGGTAIAEDSLANNNGPGSVEQISTGNTAESSPDEQPTFADGNGDPTGMESAPGNHQNTIGTKATLTGNNNANTVVGKTTSKPGASHSTSSAESSQNDATTFEAEFWTFAALLMVLL